MPDFYNNVRRWIEETIYMYDLTKIFDYKEDMYYDNCHATDEGNEIIADSIFEVIVEKIRRN